LASRSPAAPLWLSFFILDHGCGRLTPALEWNSGQEMPREVEPSGFQRAVPTALYEAHQPKPTVGMEWFSNDCCDGPRPIRGGATKSTLQTLKPTAETNHERETSMARYITLIRFTDQGARAIQKSAARAGLFRKATEKAGVTVEAQYWTTGAYDGVLILSADSAQKVLHCLTELAAAGNVRPESMQAFDAKEFASITGQ
jgi:uncharacterized protein with GYD domain